jgi:hypothetical protein
MQVFIVYTRSLAVYHTRPTKTGFYSCAKWGVQKHKKPIHSFILREREREREAWMDKESIEEEKDKTKHAHTQASK